MAKKDELKSRLKLEMLEIVDNCDRVRSEIDVATESLIDQLQQYRLSLFKEIDNYEQKCIESNKKLAKQVDEEDKEIDMDSHQVARIEFQNLHFKFNKNILGRLSSEVTKKSGATSRTSIPNFDSDYNPIYDYDLSLLTDLDFMDAKARQLDNKKLIFYSSNSATPFCLKTVDKSMKTIEQTRRFYEYNMVKIDTNKNTIVCLVKNKSNQYKLILLDDTLDVLNETGLNFDFDNLAVNKSYIICFWNMSCIKVLDWYLNDVTTKFEFLYWLNPHAELEVRQIKLDTQNNLFIHFKIVGQEGHFMKIVDLVAGKVLCEFKIEFMRRDINQFEIFSDGMLLFYEKFKRIVYFFNWRSVKLEREEEISLTDYLDLVRVDYFYFLFYDKENKKIYKF
jgi:hypothetical protein